MRVLQEVEATDDPVHGRHVALAVASAVFVLAAVGLEMFAGTAANSPAPSWAARAVPLAWPQQLRVVWWLMVAAAAFGFRLGLHRLGFRQRPWIVAASVIPFVVFAAGIALAADWATWH